MLRTASAGIVTGALVAIARIAGETAPLLFTAFGNQFWSTSLNQPIAALPLQIYTYAVSPYDEWHAQAWAGALVLIALIFVISLIARFATRGQFGTPKAKAAELAARTELAVGKLDAFFGNTHAVRDVSLDFPARLVTAIIGPSGCGKSTLLRCLNRMHETVPTARVNGTVVLEGMDIYGTGVNATEVRKRIGMVFQRPTPFPTMPIRDNVAAGLRVKHPKGHHRRSTHEVNEIVEKALRRAALWDEVKDRLRDAATGLSGGQQQRLCIARGLATEPDVLLLDEPTASLDPISTQKVEELVYELRGDMTTLMHAAVTARAMPRTTAPSAGIRASPRGLHTWAIIA